MRVPHVEDQYHPGFRAVIPRLVFVGIVEDDDLAFLPGMDLTADLERAVFRHDQRQMADDPGISDAAVRQQMGAWSKDREQDFGTMIAYPGQGQAIERGGGYRTTGAVVFATH